MPRKRLRDYQKAMLDSIIGTEEKNSINVMEPGGGKTLVMSRLAEYFLKRGKSVVVLSISVLVRKQLEDEFSAEGVSGCVFSSPLIMFNRPDDFVPDVFIIDEAHHAVADKYLELFKKFPETKRYGFTATPVRNDKKGLGDVFDYIYTCTVDTKGLIKRGVLEPFIYYAPSTSGIAGCAIDPKHLKVGKGGYRLRGENTPYFQGREIYGDIIDSWKKYAGGDYKTLLFAPDVDSAEVFADRFAREGVSCTYISSRLPINENFERIEGFKSGKYQVLCNYNMVSEGFNLPSIDCVILTHTTASYTLYKQRVFRALRKSSNNRHAVVLDHGDNSSIHGMLDELRVFSIDTSDEVKEKEERERDFDRLGGDWGYFENRGVELVEVYRYGKGYNSKYDKLIEKANQLANMEGLMLLFEIQSELGIRSSGNAPAWAYAYAWSRGYSGIPDLDDVK